MFDPDQVPAVESDELLARFILFSRHIRSSDNTVKADAFLPHPRAELSVTRHREASEPEIWNEGRRVASLRKTSLYGRADVTAAVFLLQGLTVKAAPITENPNHADVVDWPSEKPEQKIKALFIANESRFYSVPSE